jgi:hypothetical protein
MPAVVKKSLTTQPCVDGWRLLLTTPRPLGRGYFKSFKQLQLISFHSIASTGNQSRGVGVFDVAQP